MQGIVRLGRQFGLGGRAEVDSEQPHSGVLMLEFRNASFLLPDAIASITNLRCFASHLTWLLAILPAQRCEVSLWLWPEVRVRSTEHCICCSQGKCFSSRPMWSVRSASFTYHLHADDLSLTLGDCPTRGHYSPRGRLKPATLFSVP